MNGGTSMGVIKGMYINRYVQLWWQRCISTYPANVWSTTNPSGQCNNAVFKCNIYSNFALADFVNPPIICLLLILYFSNSKFGNFFFVEFRRWFFPVHKLILLTYLCSGVYQCSLLLLCKMVVHIQIPLLSRLLFI